MRVLILDTSTSVFSAAIADDGVLLGEVGGAGGAGASAQIPVQIGALLQRCGTEMAAIDAFAVTIGPGSFTGVRVGIALVKGMAFARSRPVIPLSSLELLAMNAADSPLPVCPMFDARKGEVYAALYRSGTAMTPIIPEGAFSPGRLLDRIAGAALFIGDGTLRYRDLLTEQLGDRAVLADDRLHLPSAAAGVALAFRHLDAGRTLTPVELLPNYLRLSEAELNRR